MKKVGIITIHRHINPGCALQAYGLQAAIQQSGYNSEIIDYYYPNSFHQKPSLKSKSRKILSHYIKRLFCGNAYQITEDRFNEFFRKEFHLSKDSYKDPAALQNNPPDYDIYCVGSDQVWHPKGTMMDSTFYCAFAPEGKPVVSYASSFGVTKIPTEYQERYKQYFSRFEMFGVREQSGVELIKQLTGKDATLVVDPTLLLNAEDWFKKLPPFSTKEPYILCYGCPYPNRYVEQMALHVQKQTGLKIYHLYGLPWQRFDRRITHIYDVGPWEFLSWIKNASLVLTTSFHATIFSINFKVPFYSIYYDQEGGSRQINILNCLGLQQRGVKAGVAFPGNDFFGIDFATAHPKLDKMRQASYEYLRKMLSVCDGLGNGS